MQSPTPAPPFELFSTSGVQASRRVELWEAHNARALVGLDCRTLDGSPLEAREMNLHVGGLRFAQVAATKHMVERSTRQITRTATDSVAMYFTLAGESFFYHSEGVHLLAPGRVLICDADRPFVRGFASGLKEFVVMIPRGRVPDLAAAHRLEAPVVWNFGTDGDPAAQDLARLVEQTLAHPDRHPEPTTEVSALALLHELLTAPAARGDRAHHRRALGIIDRRLTEATLSVRDVAEACGISVRHLSRVFAEHGDDGVARTILDHRLLRAHHLLASRPDVSIGHVAASCGFASHSHFTRAFRAHFGTTPAATRAAGSTVPRD
jgi:AraC-like DNA-binding protein